MIQRQMFKSLEIVLGSEVIYRCDNSGDYNFPREGNMEQWNR